MAQKNLNKYHEENLRKNGLLGSQEYLETKGTDENSAIEIVRNYATNYESSSDNSNLIHIDEAENTSEVSKKTKSSNIKQKISFIKLDTIKTEMKKHFTPDNVKLDKIKNDSQYNGMIDQIIDKTHLTDLDKDNIYNLFDRVDDLYNQRLDAINSNEPDFATSLLVQMDLLLEHIENNAIKKSNHSISKIQKLKGIYSSSSFLGVVVCNAINYADTLSDFYQNRFVVQYKNLRMTEYILNVSNTKRKEYGLARNQVASDYLFNFSKSMEGKAIFDVDNVIVANFSNDNIQVVKRDDIKSVWEKEYKALATNKNFDEYGKESILILLAKQYDIPTDKVLKIMEDINFGKQNRDEFIRNLVVANGTAKILPNDMKFVIEEMASINDFEYKEFLLDIKDEKLGEGRKAEMTDLNEGIITYKASQQMRV